MRIIFFVCLAVLGLGTAVLSQPDVGLTAVLYLRPFGGIVTVGIMTGFFYLLATLPWAVLRNRTGIGLSLVSLTGLAFGPAALALFEADKHAQTLNAELAAPAQWSGNATVIDLVDDRPRGGRCAMVCASLLNTDSVQAVRILRPGSQTKQIFSIDPDTGLTRRATDQPVPNYSNDGFAAADLAVETTTDTKVENTSWMMKIDRETIHSVRAGGYSKVRPGALVAQNIIVDFNRPVWPTLFKPATHGLVSGGNDGGVHLVRTRVWHDEAGDIAGMVAALHSAGLRLASRVTQ